MDVPADHPRRTSLETRHKLVEAYKQDILAAAGLIAHGRGEAFDYIIGETSIPPAKIAEEAAAAMLLIAEKPVISVNGNVAVLCPREIATLAEKLGAKIEVNLFYRTPERMENIVSILQSAGATNVLGLKPDSRIEGIDHKRGLCCKDGIGSADVVLVPLEDGDRCQALVRSGKKVCVIDLNPFSRSSLSATISIMDDVTRAMKSILNFTDEMSWITAEKLASRYNNPKTLSVYIRHINKRLMALAKEQVAESRRKKGP